MKYKGDGMWQIFFVLAIKLIQVGLYVLLYSLRLTWSLIKWEFRAIKTSYQKYPIGFFSFFIHFFLFFIVLFWNEVGGSEIWLRLYTLGTCGNMDDYIRITIIPLEVLNIGLKIESDFWQFIVMFGMIFLLFPCMVLSIEMPFVFFPIIQSIITQIILGIPLKGFVAKWRMRQTEKCWGRMEKRAQKNRVLDAKEMGRQEIRGMAVQSQNNAGGAIQQIQYRDEGDGLCSVEFIDAPPRKVLRELDPTYRNVLDRIGMKSIKLDQIYMQLVELKGKNAQIEKFHNEMVSINNELQCIYMEAFQTISYSEDNMEVQQAYADLKKAVQLTKNAQADFMDKVNQVYGVNIKNVG